MDEKTLLSMEHRAEVIKAMDLIVSCINNEAILDCWLMYGVADGDIPNSAVPLSAIVDMGYCEDETFRDLMTLFLKLMRRAGENGGLYADGIVSDTVHLEWR
jgi:hypothetical protein